MKTYNGTELAIIVAGLLALGAVLSTAHAQEAPRECKAPTDASGYFSDGTRNKPFKFVSARKLASMTKPDAHYMEFQVSDWQGGLKCAWNPKPRVVSEAYVAPFLSEADRAKYRDGQPEPAQPAQGAQPTN